MKQLIINADDLGLSRGTNRAIADCFARGLVTSTSLLVNMPASSDALRVLREQPDLPVGLHVCLTSGRAVLPPTQVPLLVDNAGRFRHSFVGLWRLLRSRQRAAAVQQIAAEIRAQWQLADSWGVSLNHVDSHQHVHMLPDIFRVVTALANAAGLPLRVSTERLRLASVLVGPKRCTQGITGVLKAVLLAACALRVSALAPAIRRSDRCCGIVHTGRMTSEVLRHLFMRCPAGVTELITHPRCATDGEDSDEWNAADRQFLQSPLRCQEYNALLDPQVHEALQQAGVELLRERNRQPAVAARAAG